MAQSAVNHTSMTSAVEFAIARALALQVRAMTADQVARCWFRGKPIAMDALDGLCKRELIERVKVEAHPLTLPSKPLFSWRPQLPAPPEGQWETIAACTRQRWRSAHVPVEVFRATKRASRVFGAFVDSRHLRSCEASHDLNLAEVFILYREQKPRLAARWLGESAFPKLGFSIRGMKDPDAFLVDGTGAGMRVIECSGRYEAEHLRVFHSHCAGGAGHRLGRGLSRATMIESLYPAEGIGYELW